MFSTKIRKTKVREAKLDMIDQNKIVRTEIWHKMDKPKCNGNNFGENSILFPPT